MRCKALKVKVEFELQAITCPGVWLCPCGKVTAQIFMLNTCTRTSLLDPIFPMLCHEKFEFKKIFYDVRNLKDIDNFLRKEDLYVELVQWRDKEVGNVLAFFRTSLAELLYPPAWSKGIAVGVDVDLLMEATSRFPGIIAPKLEVSTKTTIEEVLCKTPLEKRNNNELNNHLPQNVNKRPIPIRQKRVCHSYDYHKARMKQDNIFSYHSDDEELRISVHAQSKIPTLRPKTASFGSRRRKPINSDSEWDDMNCREGDLCPCSDMNRKNFSTSSYHLKDDEQSEIDTENPLPNFCSERNIKSGDESFEWKSALEKNEDKVCQCNKKECNCKNKSQQKSHNKVCSCTCCANGMCMICTKYQKTFKGKETTDKAVSIQSFRNAVEKEENQCLCFAEPEIAQEGAQEAAQEGAQEGAQEPFEIAKIKGRWLELPQPLMKRRVKKYKNAKMYRRRSISPGSNTYIGQQDNLPDNIKYGVRQSLSPDSNVYRGRQGVSPDNGRRQSVSPDSNVYRGRQGVSPNNGRRRGVSPNSNAYGGRRGISPDNGYVGRRSISPDTGYVGRRGVSPDTGCVGRRGISPDSNIYVGSEFLRYKVEPNFRQTCCPTCTCKPMNCACWCCNKQRK